MKITFVMGLLLLSTKPVAAAIQNHQGFQYRPAESVVVAVIDTGTDVKHPALKPVIWINPGESGLDEFGRDKSTNKIDDDGNGYADDLHGWNFVLNSPDVFDENGHGTHISGVIKSSFEKNNRTQKSLQLMILKYYNPNADDLQNIENTVKAINYAIQMKAQVVNYSGGGSSPSAEEFKALKRAEIHNILVVAAAGNNQKNTDISKYFPASYNLQNIISVAAVDQNGELSKFSNYGEKSVDVAAPGHRIFSTLPNGQWGYMSGTSQSTAYVSGFLAQHLARNDIRRPASAMLALLDDFHFQKSLVGKTKYRVALTTP